MTRPPLKSVPRSRKSGPSLSVVKKALRLFKSAEVPKAVYRRNAMRWIEADTRLGAKHLLRGGEPRWGVPGEPVNHSVFAPRRMERA